MSSLAEFVDVQISLLVEPITRQGFATLLLITVDTTEDAGTMMGPYSSLAEVAADYADTSDPYKAAVKAFSQGEGFSQFKVYHAVVSAINYGAQLTAAILEDNDFYGVIIDSVVEADILALAAIAESTGKLFLARSADAGILTTSAGNVAEDLLAASYTRTHLMHVGTATQWADAALAGRMLPIPAGTQTAAYKTLSGVTAVNYTTAQRTALNNQRCNSYTKGGGLSYSTYGYMSSPGWFFDLRIFIDELQVRLQEDVLARLVSRDIPYREPGPTMIREIIASRLSKYATAGVIEFNPKDIFVPNPDDQTAQDRAARLVRGVTFLATYVAFGHNFKIHGTIVV